MSRFGAWPVLAGALLFSALSSQVCAQPTPAWAQSQSDLKPDPGVRFGVLANGMRYAILRNETPKGETSLRLRIGSGSLEESDAEQGIAHVLEHMAFRGSKNVPSGDMIKILERHGLDFGPDTNAETEWTQTVYMLDLPHSDPATLDTGLMLMREDAGNLLIEPKALDAERGVVLSEERLRDTPNYRAEKSQLELFLDGQLAARRFPIGTTEVIRNAPASLVRRFYEANYRPDRATLVVVGDVDPAAVEAQIRTLFGDWRPVGPETATPELGTVKPRGLTVRQVSLPGSSTRSVIAYAKPHDGAPDTEAKEIRETRENIAIAILNRRLARLAQSDNPPFLSASVSYQNYFDSAKLAALETTSEPSGWAKALSASERTLRETLQFGVSRAEMDREIAEMHSAFLTAVAGAATRPTTNLANEIVRTVDENEVFTPPAVDLKVFEDAVRDVTPAMLDAALHEVFSGSGPLVELAGPEAPAGGDAEVARVFEAAAGASLQAPAAQGAVAWPYASFGPPGRVVSRREIADLGVTQVTFANGVRLSVKPTALRKDQVLVSVDVGAGRLAQPSSGEVPQWTVGALISGGFAKMSFEDAQRALAGKVYGVTFQVTDDAYQFHGGTRPQDLDTELQLIAAYVSDPGYRPEAFERLRNGFLTELPQIEATPSGVFQRDSGSLWTRGDPRFEFPTREQIARAKPSDLKALLADALAHGRIEATIVGDVTVEAAIAQVGRTLGALGLRETSLAADPRSQTLKFPGPTPEPVLRTDTGRPDQAIAVAAWPMTDFYADMKGSRAAMLAGEVLGDRLLDKMRIEEGATYSPETTVELSQVFPGFGYGYSLVEAPPAKLPGFFSTLSSLASDMAQNGVSADELVRVKAPKIAGLRRAQLTNEYWLADLDGSQADPRRLALIRSTFPDYEALTTADIQAAAKRWFRGEASWRMIVEARGVASAASPGHPAPAAGASASPAS
ncbi:MAG TPA: insulinase family protein [Caulobacteraceae bacterium]|jgi:zinc protease|nr:insulinase family protein [Caulobacteraceae bacterium]